MNYYIIAADRIINNTGNHFSTEKVLTSAKKKKLTIRTLEIVTLAKPWEENLKDNEFKSGASVMAAINKARKLLMNKKSDLVVIKGQDLLKTGYTKEERENFMKLYKKKFTPLDGYNKLVPVFLKYHKLSEKDYFKIRDALFENYLVTWKHLHPDASHPDEKWLRPITKYFRGVDCANPSIDYSAQMILTTKKYADLLKISNKERIKVIGNSFTKLTIDGYESISKIAPYLHLKKIITKAQSEARIDFKGEFFKGRASLDAYTCYPLVPMGLILRLGLVKNLNEIPELLKTHEVTITGGLNLAKAAWNLTSLNGIIAMRDKIIKSKKTHYGLVHGNGSLGNQQGITLLGK